MDSWARDELHFFEMRGRWGALDVQRFINLDDSGFSKLRKLFQEIEKSHRRGDEKSRSRDVCTILFILSDKSLAKLTCRGSC